MAAVTTTSSSDPLGELGSLPRSSFSARGYQYKRDKRGHVVCVGKGSFGVASLVVHPTGTFVAKEMDVTRMSAGQQKDARKEVELLQRLQHAFIIRAVDCFVDPTAGVLEVVMEYAEGGDLEAHIRCHCERRTHFNLKRVLLWFVQACYALQYLHHQHILHRDIKPANMFLTSQGVLKLGDFGYSRELSSTLALAHTRCGTPYYLSPEICNARPYSNKSDVWSLGVVLYELLTLRKPFEGLDLSTLFNNIAHSPYPPLRATLPAPLQQLIGSLLTKHPRGTPEQRFLDSRPSVGSILAGRHPQYASFLQPFIQQVGTQLATMSEGMKFCEADTKVADETATQVDSDVDSDAIVYV